MKRLTDGERETLAELERDAEGLGPDCFDPYERQEYERWLDQLDGQGGYDEPTAAETEDFPF